MNRLAWISFLVLVPASFAGAEPAVNERGVSFEQFTRGGQLFQEHCAQCHGAAAQGAPDWDQKGPDGRFGAPPLNGAGHAWHHSREQIAATIRNGTQVIGGSMPPWKERIGEDDIAAIVGWLISRWPDEVYAAWARRFGGKEAGH